MVQAWQVAIGAFVLAVISSGVHTVDEGYVGIYWRGGALLNTYSEPGFNVKLPFITSFEQVQVSVQTDRVTNIPCGTSGGVLLTFETVEVVNQLTKEAVVDTVRAFGTDYDQALVYSRIHHKVNEFCSVRSLSSVYIHEFPSLDEGIAEALQRDCEKWAPGLRIIAVRVTKPRLPRDIAQDYEEMEVRKADLLVSTQHQKVVEKKAETEKLRAQVEAQRDADVSRIENELRLKQKQADQIIQRIRDEIHIAKERTRTDAVAYRKKRHAEANELRYNGNFLKNELFVMLQQQEKLYFGSSVAELLDNNKLVNLTAVLNESTDVMTKIQEHLDAFAKGEEERRAKVAEAKASQAAAVSMESIDSAVEAAVGEEPEVGAGADVDVEVEVDEEVTV